MRKVSFDELRVVEAGGEAFHGLHLGYMGIFYDDNHFGLGVDNTSTPSFGILSEYLDCIFIFLDEGINFCFRIGDNTQYTQLFAYR